MRKPRKPRTASTPQPPAPPEIVLAAPSTKIQQLVTLLRQPDGALIDQLMAATGWQAHSVRGAMSGALKKKLKLTITSEKTEAGRVYRIAEAAQA